MPKPVYWLSKPPAACDITNEPIADEFIDGATVTGPWACMTPQSFKRYGVGLGTGKGQRYQRQTDGRYLKVEG